MLERAIVLSMQSNEITEAGWVTSGLKITHYAVETISVERSTNGSGNIYSRVRTACGSLLALRTADDRNVKCPKCKKALKS